MIDQSTLFRLLAEGNVEGFTSVPRMVETVVSRVFFFDADKTVLKFYKRDNAWWNTEMRDLSGGESRETFIEDDFAFNHMLNPQVYVGLKTVVLDGEKIRLVDMNGDEDELVIVMRMIDVSKSLTHVLDQGGLSLEQYESIGTSFAHTKSIMPLEFLPALEANWYQQMRARLQDLSSWIKSVGDFPSDIAEEGTKKLQIFLDAHREECEAIFGKQLSVLIDCHSENLLFVDDTLTFLDAYPPKREWLSGVFEVDIFRVGSDIHVLAGKEAYEAYLLGAREKAGNKINMEWETFYLLYAALISAPYFYMLASKTPSYRDKATRYLAFIKELSASKAFLSLKEKISAQD